MLVLMSMLVVFAALSRVRSPHVRYAALTFMYFALLVTIVTASLLITSTFWDFPKSLPELLGVAEPLKIAATISPETYAKSSFIPVGSELSIGLVGVPPGSGVTWSQPVFGTLTPTNSGAVYNSEMPGTETIIATVSNIGRRSATVSVILNAKDLAPNMR